MNFTDRIGLQMYTVREESGKDFFGTLEKIAAMGYRNVEFAGFFNTPAEVLKDTLDRLSLAPVSSHVGMNLLRDDLDNTIAYHKTLGTRYIILPWAKTDTLDDVKEIAGLLNSIAPKIHEAGMELGYHNHAHEFRKIDGKYAIDILLELTERAGVFPEFDVFWIRIAGLDPVDIISKYGSRCRIIHLKDMKTAGEKQFAEVGSGIIDMKKVIQKGLEFGANYFIVEQDICDRPCLESVNISLNNLRVMAKELNI